MISKQRYSPSHISIPADEDLDPLDKVTVPESEETLTKRTSRPDKRQSTKDGQHDAQTKQQTTKAPSPSQTPNRKSHSTANRLLNRRWWLVKWVVLVLAVLAAYMTWTKNTSIPLRPSIKELKRMFKAQDSEFWIYLEAATMPSKLEAVKTFLFLHSSRKTSDCFLKTLAGPDCDVYRAEDLASVSTFVDKATNNLRTSKCMVIHDLEKISSGAIVFLKGFCDAYTPIVHDSNFYFALYSDEKGTTHSNVQKRAYDTMESLWSNMSTSDEYGGTLTRLTQNVFDLREEKRIPC